MFCGKCGAKNEDHVAFCANCGAKLNGASSTSTVTLSTPSQNHQNRRVGIIAVAVVAVAVVLLGVFLFGGRSYKSTVEKYIDYQFSANAEGMVSLIPSQMIEYILEQDGYDAQDLSKLIDELENELQSYGVDALDSYLGEGWEMSYEILNASGVTGDDLDNIKGTYENAGIKVSAAKNVEVDMEVKGPITNVDYTMNIYLVKVGRSWYLDVASMGNLF